MNKKLKYLSAIPLFGTCILLIYLFFSCLKEEISKKKFAKTFIICAIVSVICWYLIMMIVYIISKKLIYFNFNNLGILITMIIGGYMINMFTFKYIDIKWNYLFCYEPKEEKSFLEGNKNQIIKVAFFLAVVITVLTLATIFVLKLI